MKRLKYRPIIIYIVFLFAIIFQNPAFSETTKNKMVIGDAAESIEITTDGPIEIDIKGHVITFTDNVEAVRDDINIKCQRIEFFYENSSDNDDLGTIRISEIIATENVRVTRPDPDGGDEITATAEKAVYDQKGQKLVLTGNPVAKQGTNSLEGAKITLFLKEGRCLVEGAGDSNAKAVVLFPNE